MGDDEDKQPLLRVVSDNPSARTDQRIQCAKDDVERTLSVFAAALLRTMAGSENESIYLLRRLSDFLDRLGEFREHAGHGLSAFDLEQMLRLPRAEYVSTTDEWEHRNWLRKHGFDEIVKGALRLAAHKVLGEKPHFGGKYSEDVIESGIKTLEELKRPLPKPSHTSETRSIESGWDDLDLARSNTNRGSKLAFGAQLKRAESPASPRRRRAVRSFSQEDLKELRKAIKANDRKRIAELTSKIGKVSEDPSLG